MPSEIRVRIAPSPSGFLHVGTARTALFNFLYAKGHGGKFILRIEDTDRERSQDIYTQNIFDSLKALGLQWDEGPDIGGPYAPYAQSERTEIYQKWANQLLTSGNAYFCYLTQAELEAEKAQAQAEKRTYIYSGVCRDAKKREELAAQPAEDGTPRKPSIRFRIPDDRGTLTFQDAVRGDVSFDTQLLGDFVIMKSDGTPSYNFAVVVDDMLMKISHVIRGEDHISNTPRQILIYEAFGITPPEFGHAGMILAPDRTKLSKRHGAVAVSDYIKEGYLPEAFCNFLTLLGWSPPDGEEIGTLDHFAQQFELGRITHSPAIFEKDKLNFINSKLIRSLPLDQLLKRARPYLHAFDLSQYSTEQLHQILDAVREPITVLSDLPDAVNYFFGRIVIIDAQLVGEVLTGPEPAQILQAFKHEWLPAADFNSAEALAEAMKAFTNRMKPIKTKTVMWTIRAAVTGRTQGADLSKALHILGRDVVHHRVDTALTLTTASPA
jgi:glutamyl-tRNA synthetase